MSSTNQNFGPKAEFDKAECRSCGKPIVWVTCDGKRIPLDPAPPIYIAGRDSAGKVHAVRPYKLLGSLGRPAAFAGVSHFATCPNAQQHSRKAPRERSCPACGLMHSEAECPGCIEAAKQTPEPKGDES